MPSTIYALVDCNNFFVSCERVFNPKLHNRPVIVLSNNDGCIISRSNEAKALGIPMGVPLFKIQGLVAKHKVAVLSSNFALYGDLSSRVMRVIGSSVPNLEIYSIDEAFLPGVDMQLCKNLVRKIERYTGIPVSIGLAPTRTLAKMANYLVKKHHSAERVLYLDKVQKIPVQEIWGIGRKLSKRLEMLGIYTAEDLINLNEKFCRKEFSVVMWRIVQELNGISCIEFEDNSLNKQQIMVSRSFSHKLNSLSDIRQALVTHISSACIKLRNQNSVAGGIYVFLQRGLYENFSDYMQLPSKTADSRIIITHAAKLLEQLFIAGHAYRKVGIILCDLSSALSMQLDIFGHTTLDSSDNLMLTIDKINNKLGHNTLQFAAAGIDKHWQTKVNKKSNNFTGSWLELPIVRIVVSRLLDSH